MTAQMASESRLRTTNWLKNGCNGFDMKSPISNPMSFWTEQDVLEYIFNSHIPIADVYGEVTADFGEAQPQGNTMDMGIFDVGKPVFDTTGCDRVRFLRVRVSQGEITEPLGACGETIQS